MSRRRVDRMKGALALLVSLVVSVAIPVIGVGQVPRVQRVIEIGCEDCGGARQFSSTWDVAVTDAGDVLVVDRDAPTSRMFDKAGRPLWTRGRPGAGPGEYRFAMRAAVAPDGSVQVVDMRLRRLTRLARDGAVAQSLTFPFFPAGVAVRRQEGELVFLTDEIHRLSPAGAPLPPLARDIARVRRTPEEMAAEQQRIGSVGGAAKAAAEGKQSGGSKSVLPRDNGLEFKPHAPADALRYDDAGRLWVRTMRGTTKATVFDIFTASGAYAGELTVPMRVEAYSVAGAYLATGGRARGRCAGRGVVLGAIGLPGARTATTPTPATATA